jgi:hypothetical protein
MKTGLAIAHPEIAAVAAAEKVAKNRVNQKTKTLLTTGKDKNSWGD